MGSHGESIFVISGIVPLQNTGALIAPFINLLLARLTTKQMLFYSQLISALISLIILVLYVSSNLGLTGFSLLILANSVFSNIFSLSREIHSKHISTLANNIQVQSTTLAGFYKAQFLGPVISMFLITILPLWIPLLFDILSFFLSAFIVSRANLTSFNCGRSNPLRPLLYLHKNKSILTIFTLRSLGFWIGGGIFNFIVFSIITERYAIDPINSAWVYSAVGFGATISTFYLRSKISFSKIHLESFISFIGHAGIALSSIGFYYLHNYFTALLLMVIYGVFMSLNAIGSQAIRRRLIPIENFSEVVWLESFVSKFTELVVSLVVMTVLIRVNHNIEFWLFISAISTFLVGYIYILVWPKENQAD